MMDQLEQLFHDVGEEFDILLKPDQYGAVKLRIGPDIFIQMEYNKAKDWVAMVSFIGDLPPGKFRENLLKTALKANHQQPSDLHLAYSDKNNQLALFYPFPMSMLSKDLLVKGILSVVEKSRAWRQGIATGNLASLVTISSQKSSGFFGMAR